MSLVHTAPDHSIQVILAPSMSAKSIEREMAAYRNSPERELYAWVERGRPVAAAGLRRTGDAADLLHIATAPAAAGVPEVDRLSRHFESRHFELRGLAATARVPQSAAPAPPPTSNTSPCPPMPSVCNGWTERGSTKQFRAS